MKQQLILCINLGYEGGCVYYANHLLDHFPEDKTEIWISSSCIIPCRKKALKVNVYKGLWGQLYSWCFLLPYYLLKVVYGILWQRYCKVIVFGPHNWDVAFIWLFRLFRKESYLVIHDGVMHLGESSKLHQVLMNAEMRYASHWVFLSDFVRRRVEKHLGMQKANIIIPHGIIRYGAEANWDAVPQKYNLLLIGRINYYKGIALLIDALPLLDFTKIGTITIAGVFDNSFDISAFENYSSVKLINKYLTDEEFDSLVSESHLLLMPYLEASQSGVAAISLGYNIPAIATQVGGIPEQLSVETAYYMDDVKAIALKQTIELAVNDPDLYLEKKANLKNAAEALNWKKLSSRLFAYISE